MPKSTHAVPLMLLAIVYVAVSVWPAWQGLHGGHHAQDWASYHYAVQALHQGENPYVLPVLEQLAARDGLVQTVYPYLYPPPFLLSVWWMAPLSPEASRDVLFVLNQLAWPLLLGVLWRWFRASPLLLMGILVTLTPIAHAGRLGQVNGMVALLVGWALWRRGGLVLAAAAMIKMSPALYLPVWAAQRHWRPLLWAVLGATGLSVLALAVVPLDVQRWFYLEILPGFSSGSYNGLAVPIDLPANHSVPSALNKLFPGEDANTLSPAVRRLSTGLLVGGMGGVVWLSRRRMDALAEANLMGAWTIWLVVMPVFSYEHHLSLLLLPCAALGTALLAGRLPRWAWGPALLGYGCVAWPLSGFRLLLRQFPQIAAGLEEGKLLAALLLMGMCLWTVARSVKPSEP